MDPTPPPPGDLIAFPIPFNPIHYRQLAARYRRALVRIFTPEEAEAAGSIPDQVFDFPEGVRLVLGLQEGVDNRLILAVSGEPIPPIRSRINPEEMPLVIWLYKLLTLWHDIPLHVYHDGYRVHLILPAPPGSGEPLPPEPEPPPVLATVPGGSSPFDAVEVIRETPTAIEVDIPPSLREHKPEKLIVRVIAK